MATTQDNWTATECEGTLETMQALEERMKAARTALERSKVMDEVELSMVRGRASVRMSGY